MKNWNYVIIYNNEDIIHIINDIIDVIIGTMKKIINSILNVHEHHFVCVICVFHLIFSFQNDIHRFSQQYGHCMQLISSALLHFGQSL